MVWGVLGNAWAVMGEWAFREEGRVQEALTAFSASGSMSRDRVSGTRGFPRREAAMTATPLRSSFSTLGVITM